MEVPMRKKWNFRVMQIVELFISHEVKTVK